MPAPDGRGKSATVVKLDGMMKTPATFMAGPLASWGLYHRLVDNCLRLFHIEIYPLLPGRQDGR